MIITKYIDVEVSLKKTIPIEEEDLEKAIAEAEEIFCENELTSEYLNDRYVNFSENKNIINLATGISKLILKKLGSDFSRERVENYFYNNFEFVDNKDLVFDEILKVLENDYDISFENISI